MVSQCKNLISLYILPDQRQGNLLVNHKHMEDSTIQSKQSYTKNFRFSIFYVAPLYLIIALIFLVILSIKLWQYSLDISFTQTSFIAFTNSAPLNGCFSDTLFFMLVRKFSMGLNPDCFLATRKGRCCCYPENFLQLWNGGKGRYPT